MRNCITLIALIIAITVLHPAQNFAQIQSDTSDAYWVVVLPHPASQDIDMKQCLVGKSKDSIVSAFVRNTGAWKFRVDSIYFRGGDAASFGLISGLPIYTVGAGGSHAGEFHFRPEKVGIHTAEIVIVTQAETMIQNIRGEGVLPTLGIENKLIDFGQVIVSGHKDTIAVVTISNTGSFVLNILNTRHNMPNDIDFTTLAGGGAFSLNPGETHIMNLRFTAREVGLTNGTLDFEYNGIGSPAKIMLVGEGIAIKNYELVLKSDSLFAKPGDIIQVPIYLTIPANDIYDVSDGIYTELSFNVTLMDNITNDEIIKAESYSENGFYLEKHLSLQLPKEVFLGEKILLDFKVGLGNSDTTAIIFNNDSTYISGFQGASLIETNNGLLAIDVCHEGGDRLVTAGPRQVGIINIIPNPANESADIELYLLEEGRTSLILYNSIGEEVKTVYEGNPESTGFFSTSINTNNLSSGIYFIILETPTQVSKRALVISK